MLNSSEVKKELQALSNPEKALKLSRFFKTGKGEYGEGDIFLGITVPEQRKVAKKFSDLPLQEVSVLLNDPLHEYRLTALLILVEQYRTRPELRESIAAFYLNSSGRINNWDLVDLSCYKILGPHLENRDRSVLYELAGSGHLWKQRISVVTTFHFIKNSDFSDTVKLCEELMHHEHDLIHKATGWMLRESGKRDISVLRGFLDTWHTKMPRTMLRYAVEKLQADERKKYMKRD